MLKKILLVLVLVCMSSNLMAEDNKASFDKAVADIPGDEIDSVIRVYTQTISYPFPKEWGVNPVFKNQKDNRFIIEFIPKGQTLNDWKDMFTIQGFQSLAGNNNVSPEKMVLVLRQQFEKVAPSKSYYKEIYNGDVNGYSGIIVLMGIKEMPKNAIPTTPKGAGEVGLYLALKGKRDMYLIHRSWKTELPYSDEKLPFDRSELDKWVKSFKKIKLILNP